MQPIFPDNPAHNDAAPAFPTVQWGRQTATFFAADGLPESPSCFAALVFAIQDGEFLLADIAGRGWCIPGGRLEAGETPAQAARRETREETGATLGPLHLLGYYLVTENADSIQRLIPAYRAEVVSLEALPHGTESQGICRVRYEEIPARYFSWDALLAAVFALAWASVQTASD